MIDPNFRDPEQAQRLHQQKMDAMKVLMSDIIDNPSGSEVNELKQIIDYLDTNPTLNGKDD